MVNATWLGCELDLIRDINERGSLFDESPLPCARIFKLIATEYPGKKDINW